MSIKTNFKRIALVAVAALGLGVLTSVPSQATASSITLTGVNGTATTVTSDSTTAGTVSLSFIGLAADTFTVRMTMTSSPGSNTTLGVLRLSDTTSARVDTNFASAGDGFIGFYSGSNGRPDTVSVAQDTNFFVGPNDITVPVTTAVRSTATMFVELASTPVYAGDYSFLVSAWPMSTGKDTVTATVKITVTADAAASSVSSGTYSSAVLTSGSTFGYGAKSSTNVDSSVAALATASATAKGVVRVYLRNASDSTAAQESITATMTGAGTIGDSSVQGKSVKLAYTYADRIAGYKDLTILSDGTAGTGTIGVSTSTVTFASKTVSFYSATVSTINATKLNQVIGVGTTASVLSGTAKDSNKNVSASATAVYAYSSDTTTISDYGTACTYSSTYQTHFCSLTGVKAGTAKITLRDASTVALSTVSSTEVIEVTVSTGTAATVKLSFDKASYAPGEKAYVKITALDSAGKVVPSSTFTNLFAAGGISTSAGLGSSSDTMTGVSITTANRTTGAVSLDPIGVYTIYMPYGGGNVTLTATGGSSLPAAGQVAVTATASVSDSGAAALAAVTALATTVASLKTLITTLTNLVLKIQKKVKA